MPFMSRAFSLWRNVVGRHRVERDLDDEVKAMFDLCLAEKIRSGLSPEEARRAATIEFGSIEGVKDQVRDVSAGATVVAFFQDLRYAARLLRHNPVFTATTTLSLGLGLGIVIAGFVIVRSAFLQSLPVPYPSRVVAVTAVSRDGMDPYFSYNQYRQLRSQTECFSGLLAYTRHVKFIASGSESRSVLYEFVSENYFSTLGIHAVVGRTFGPSDTFDQPVAVISDALWRRQFAGDPSLIGTPILLSGKPYVVLGVLPEEFRGLQRGIPTDIWIPFGSERSAPDLVDSRQRVYQLLGRLRPEVSTSQARAEMNVLGRRLEPDRSPTTALTIVSESDRLREILPTVAVLMGAVALVLLISCANVAGLVLSRAEARRKEIAMRLALGATRGRIVRQLLTENLLMAASGGAIGILIGWSVLQLEPLVLPPLPVEVGLNLYIDWTVLAFTGLISFGTVMVFGLFPAFQTTRPDLVPALKNLPTPGMEISRSFSARNIFVVAEISLVVVLVTLGMLLSRSLMRTEAVPLGIDDAEQPLVFFDAAPGLAGYRGISGQRFFRDAAARLRSIPGVDSVSFALRVPLSASGGGAERTVSIPDVETQPNGSQLSVKFNAVGAEYFRTIGTRLLTGRTFSVGDFAPAARPTVVISQTMRKRFWPHGDPVGRHISIAGVDHEIIGVAEDVKINDVHESAEPYMYLVFGEAPDEEGTLIVRTSGDVAQTAAIGRERLHALANNVPVAVRTMDDLRELALYQDLLATGLAISLGMLAVFLAVVGIYGVTAQWMTRRRREIGIRVALGAERWRVIRLVLGQALRLAGAGIVIGLILTVSVGRVVSSFLYGLGPTDPLTLVISSSVVLVVGLSAAGYPAFRASRLDPLSALRCD